MHFQFFYILCSLYTFAKAIRILSSRKCLVRCSMMYDDCDVAVVGAGIGGLTSAAVLSQRYGLKVNVYEAHYRAGGCAHSFPIKSPSTQHSYLFDAGPTIVFGCSRPPYNPLQQVFNSIGAGSAIDWISYDSWGMYTPEGGHWNFELGLEKFEKGPLRQFGGPNALAEFQNLREACAPLALASARIPTMSLRGDKYRLIPLLLNFKDLQQLIPYTDVMNGTFETLLSTHVKDPWLRDWLDALAFSLSGLSAARTGAAAMAFTLYDMHKDGASLDYPKGGMGVISDVLVDVLKSSGGELHLSSAVESIGVENGRAVGVTLRSGKKIRAKRGVVCNANVWGVQSLLKSSMDQLTSEQQAYLIGGCSSKEMTKSFLHLHLGLDGSGLQDRARRLRPHYTVMARGLHGPGIDPCADRNMVAVSVPSVLDSSLTDRENGFIVHAYGAGNEPYDLWKGMDRQSVEYKAKKAEAAEYLYDSVGKALGISVEEVRERSDVALIGTPLTHERFLQRKQGTYGAAWGSILEGPQTPLPGLLLCGDGVFPGIGVPAVALSGSIAANTVVSVVDHMWGLLSSRC
eukprot:gene6470-13067_t